MTNSVLPYLLLFGVVAVTLTVIAYNNERDKRSKSK